MENDIYIYDLSRKFSILYTAKLCQAVLLWKVANPMAFEMFPSWDEGWALGSHDEHPTARRLQKKTPPKCQNKMLPETGNLDKLKVNT